MTLISKPSLKGLNAGGIAALEEVRATLNHAADALRAVLDEASYLFAEGSLAELWEDALKSAAQKPEYQSKKGSRK